MAKRESKVEGVNALPELEAGFAEIKNLFKAGAVPREADYAMLIEYVHYLHKLLGVEGADGSPGPGLGGGLIKETDSGLSVDASVLAGGGLGYSGSVINVGAGAGITVDTNSVILDGARVAGNGLTGAAGVINVGAGKGITVDANSVILDGANVAGNGLTGDAGVINVGAGKGILVEDNAVSLAENSWEYIFAKLYGATHWVRSERVVLYFTRVSLTHVVVRGIARGGSLFGIMLDWFTWDGYKPVAESSSIDRGYFTLLFLDINSISGTFKVNIGDSIYENTIVEINF